MRYLPIQVDVQGRPALVLGAVGEVVSKVERLLAAGAVVTVVAPGGVDPAIERLAASGAVALHRRGFDDADLDGQAIVFAATDEDVALTQRLFAWAREGARLFCAVDRPETSTFANPAVISLPDLTIAIGTGGRGPGVARRIREDLEALFRDDRFGSFMAALGALRDTLPRGERFDRMREAVSGFRVEARLAFPAWFERGGRP